jgi:hypothetical protein
MAVVCRQGVSGLKTRDKNLAGLLVLLLCAAVAAQTYTPFPGETVDARTRSIQERVESVYQSGDYARALLIYEKELAPIGDKYAQYMVGYMHLNGQGTEPDSAEALAWYRLAAERGESLLVRTRDQLAASLTPEERDRADGTFIDLWKAMSDRVLLVDLIRQDMQILRQQSGSRIPGAEVSVPTIVYTPDGVPAGPNYYRDVRARLDARLAYLDARVEISDDIVAAELERIRRRESEIKRELAAMERR